MNRIANPLTLAAPVLILTLGCYPNPNDLRTGSNSAAGGQGGLSGTGGVAAGAGGKTGGSGGVAPGTGGATGGAAAGAGGAKPGTGGTTPGTGGTPLGQGGAQAGHGGTPVATGGYAGAGTALTPNADGWVARANNAFGIQGAWYAFSDAYLLGEPAGGDCVNKGQHTLEQCSMVSAPPLGGPFRPNSVGKMCTSGTVARVLLHPVTGDEDYDNMWGASIGFDFNGTGNASPPFKYPYDAPAHGVRGIAFDIEWLVKPITGLRVVFGIQAPDGSDTSIYEYWGADPTYPVSPVVAGTNKVYWTDVASPMGDAFDPTKLGAVFFAVPTTTVSSAGYSYCISNLRVLTGTSATDM